MKGIGTFFKKYWLVIIGVLVIPIILGQVLRAPFGYLTIGKEGDWVNFFGNYSGGIIGGIVAFIVARSQIENQNKQVIIRNLSKELPVLTSIGLECDKILKQLINFDKNIDKIDKRDTYTMLFDGMIWSRWKHTGVINDPILQEELIKHQEALQRNIEIFEIDVLTLESILENKKSISRQMKPLDKGYVNLMREISKESIYLDSIKNEKIHYINELVDCIKKTERLKNIVYQRRMKIHGILSKSNFYKDELLTKPADFIINKNKINRTK